MEFNKDQKIIGIRVLSDNVIWLWEKNKSAVVIDPALSQPVIEYLKTNNPVSYTHLTLPTILLV